MTIRQLLDSIRDHHDILSQHASMILNVAWQDMRVTLMNAITEWREIRIGLGLAAQHRIVISVIVVLLLWLAHGSGTEHEAVAI